MVPNQQALSRTVHVRRRRHTAGYVVCDNNAGISASKFRDACADRSGPTEIMIKEVKRLLDQRADVNIRIAMANAQSTLPPNRSDTVLALLIAHGLM